MPGHGKQGYYFLSAFSLGCTPIAEAVGDELVKAGYIASRDIVPYTNEELRKIGVRVFFALFSAILTKVDSQSGGSSLRIVVRKEIGLGSWGGNHGTPLRAFTQTSG